MTFTKSTLLLFCFLFTLGLTAQISTKTAPYNLGLSIGQANNDFSDQKKDLSYSLLVKTSPFDFLIGRYILAVENKLSQLTSVEVSFGYDYISGTDLSTGILRDNGPLYKLDARYKVFSRMGKEFIKKGRQHRLNGIYYAPGITIGQSPMLWGRNETGFRYVQAGIPDLAESEYKRSVFVGALFDLGYALTVKKFAFETFVGIDGQYNSQSLKREFLASGIAFSRRPRFRAQGRFGLRIGYFIL